MHSRPLTILIGLLILLGASPGVGTAQVFIATHPKPEFTIGPLFVRANVGPAAGPVDVTVLFSVVVPASASGGVREQDLYLLWPGEVDGEVVAGAPEPELRRTVEARGFQVTREGRLPLSARAVYSGFNDVRTRATFPMYLAHRDRVVHLADDPSQLIINFVDSDHLKIHEVYPGSSQRRASETRRATEIVSAYLDPSEGIRPQVLSVQFGYFTGWKAWAPVLFATLFFVLGNLAGPLVTTLAKRVSARIQGRIHFGPSSSAPAPRDTGTVVPRETLARISPGETTYDEILSLCGPNPEERERLSAPGRRTLVYRGRRVVPYRQRRLGWLATVHRWDVEHHEVEIELDGDRVRDIQAQVHRSRLTQPGRA